MAVHAAVVTTAAWMVVSTQCLGGRGVLGAERGWLGAKSCPRHVSRSGWVPLKVSPRTTFPTLLPHPPQPSLLKSARVMDTSGASESRPEMGSLAGSGGLIPALCSLRKEGSGTAERALTNRRTMIFAAAAAHSRCAAWGRDLVASFV